MTQNTVTMADGAARVIYFFDGSLTMHLSITLDNEQSDAQIF